MSTSTDLADILDDTLGGYESDGNRVSSYLDTGLPELNRNLSGDPIDGGIPVGRMVEIFGPASSGKTFLSTMAMAAAQRMGGMAFFADHERSFDPVLAANLGLDVDDRSSFRWLKPKTFEESIELCVATAMKLRRAGMDMDKPIAWVFDSVASMVPHSKFYNDKGEERKVGDYNMRDKLALATATSQAYPQLSQIAADYNIAILLLNQIRVDPMAMFGDPNCLHANTKIPFADGTSKTIKEIVDKKIKKEVWSFNEATSEIEPAMITGWHNNGPITDASQWLHIRTRGIQTPRGVTAITVTPDHKVLRGKGDWVCASDISVGDQLMSRRSTRLNGTYEQFIRAAMSGDAHATRGRNGRACAIRIQDNNDPEYMRWKVGKLSKFLKFTKGIARNKGQEYEYWLSKSDWDLDQVRADLRGNRCPLQALSELSPMSLAIWIMDDAYFDAIRGRYSLSIKRFARSEDLTKLADRLFDLGFDFGVRRGEGRFDFTHESSRRLSEIIAPWVPECMEHKLPRDLRGQYVDFSLECEDKTITSLVEVRKIRQIGKYKREVYKNRYDITVEGNHTYLAGGSKNGVVVHNCTSGGKAAEFYCSVRVSLGKKDRQEGTGVNKEVVGTTVTAKTTKNKMTRPFLKAAWNIDFDEYSASVDYIGATLDYLVKAGIVERTGNRIEWEGKKLYKSQVESELRAMDNGREKLLELLRASKVSHDTESDDSVESALD